MATRDFRTRNEIIVSVNKQDEGTADQVRKKRRKGPITPSKSRPRHLPRRLTGGFVKLYDLGYRLTDTTFISNPAKITPDIDFGQPDYTYPVRTLVPADFNSLRSGILADNLSHLKDLYKQIRRNDNSQYYGLWAGFGGPQGPIDSLTQWTENGFKVSFTELNAGIVIQDTKAMFNQVDNLSLKGGVFGQKITSTPIFSDPAVPFVPALDMQVFIMPALSLSRAFSQYTVTAWTLPGYPPPNTFRSFISFLNLFWVVIPRNYVIIPSDPYFNKYTGSISNPNPFFGQLPAYQAVIDKLDAHHAIDGTRGNTYDLSFAAQNYYFSYVDPDELYTGPSGLFPRQDLMQVGFSRGSVQGSDRNGILKAIVEKGGSFYYFWSAGY